MLDVKKRVFAFLITVASLGLLSGWTLIYCQSIQESSFHHPKSNNLFIAFLFISIITILYMFFKKRFNNLLILGIICFISEIFIVFLITYPLVGFNFKSLLPHFMAVSSFCLFIPYTYSRVEELLS